MLYYLSNATIPSEKAHAIQQMKMCQSFVRTGTSTCFVYPTSLSSKAPDWADIAEYYGLDARFGVKSVPSFEGHLNKIPQIPFFSKALAVAGWTLKQLLQGEIMSKDVLYCRNYYAASLLVEIRQFLPSSRSPAIYTEYHNPEPQRYGQNRFFQSVDGVVSITHRLKEYLTETHSLAPKKCHIAPDGVDIQRYESLTTEAAREQLNIDLNETVVAYTGHLYETKGAHILARCADQLDATIYIVGGYPEDVERVRNQTRKPENLVFTGFVEPADIPCYQYAADVLVAPYTDEARQYLSPLKLFEYMAAGKAIVASRIPVLEEILTDGENALLVEPGSADDLARAIDRVLTDEDLYSRLSENAATDAKRYSWTTRAESILEFIEVTR